MTETTEKKAGISRRNFLKTGAAAAAGAAVGSGAITGFPTIWAQNPITLRQFGTGVSNLNAIAEKCKEDLGITLEMTATDSDAAAQRAVTQPDSYDIADIEYWILKKVFPTGVIQPIERINALVGPTRHTLFIDAVQAFGKCPLEFATSAPDMMAVSGHKIGAPAGIGALLVKSHADTVRLIPGGGQEQGRRGGTESAALIGAFGAAAAVHDYDAETLSGLVQHVEAGLQKLAPDVVIFGQGANRIGNVTNFAVPGVGNATAMMALDLMGLSVSSGSACSSGKVGASHVLAAMGVPRDLANCALRVSFGWNSTMADADAFLAGFETLLSRQKRAGKAA